MIDMSNKEVIEYAKNTCFITPDGEWTQEDVYEEAEVQYQFRDYAGGQFCSILVRFTCPNLPSGCYCEFKGFDYDDIYDLLSDAFSEETIDRIDKQIARKRGQI